MVIDDAACFIDISTLLANYNLDGGDSIYAKVTAANIYGESVQSESGNGAYYIRVPDQVINV